MRSGHTQEKNTQKRYHLLLQAQTFFILTIISLSRRKFMSSSSCSSVIPGILSNNRNLTYILSRRNFTRHLTSPCNGGRKLGLHLKKKNSLIVSVKGEALQYRKLGDSDLVISEITLGTVSIRIKFC